MFAVVTGRDTGVPEESSFIFPFELRGLAGDGLGRRIPAASIALEILNPDEEEAVEELKLDEDGMDDLGADDCAFGNVVAIL